MNFSSQLSLTEPSLLGPATHRSNSVPTNLDQTGPSLQGYKGGWAGEWDGRYGGSVPSAVHELENRRIALHSTQRSFSTPQLQFGSEGMSSYPEGIFLDNRTTGGGISSLPGSYDSSTSGPYSLASMSSALGLEHLASSSRGRSSSVGSDIEGSVGSSVSTNTPNINSAASIISSYYGDKGEYRDKVEAFMRAFPSFHQGRSIGMNAAHPGPPGPMGVSSVRRSRSRLNLYQSINEGDGGNGNEDEEHQQQDEQGASRQTSSSAHPFESYSAHSGSTEQQGMRPQQSQSSQASLENDRNALFGGLDLESLENDGESSGDRSLHETRDPKPLSYSPSPFGEADDKEQGADGGQQSRTLVVRNLNPATEDGEIRAVLEEFGQLRSLHTEWRTRGCVVASYYDIRHARNAMKHLQGYAFRQRNIDARYFISKENGDDREGLLVLLNVDESISDEELCKLFSQFGDLKELKEVPGKRQLRIVEFYDLRNADAALRVLNKSVIAGRRLQIEPLRPLGVRRLPIPSPTADLRVFPPSPTASPPPQHQHQQQQAPQQAAPRMSPTDMSGESWQSPRSLEHSGRTLSWPSVTTPPLSLRSAQSSDSLISMGSGGSVGAGTTGRGPILHHHHPYYATRASPSMSSAQAYEAQMAAAYEAQLASSAFENANIQGVSPRRLLATAGGGGYMQSGGGATAKGGSRSMSASPSPASSGLHANSMYGLPLPYESMSAAQSRQPMFPSGSNPHASLAQHHEWTKYQQLATALGVPPMPMKWDNSSLSGGPSPSISPSPSQSMLYPLHSMANLANQQHLSATEHQHLAQSLASLSLAQHQQQAASFNSPRSSLRPSVSLNHLPSALSPYSDASSYLAPDQSSHQSSYRKVRSELNLSAQAQLGLHPSMANYSQSSLMAGHPSMAAVVAAQKGLADRPPMHAGLGGASRQSAAMFAVGGMGAVRQGHRRMSGDADDRAQFIIDYEKAQHDKRTTLMIRNIPNKYTQKMLLAAVDERFKGLYDFFYLPIDFKNKCNVGYAFINFITTNHIVDFVEQFSNKKWDKFNSEKVCQVTYARIQGKNALIAHFQNSSLMCEDKKCRPIIFHSDGPLQGEMEPFPVGSTVRRRGGTRYTRDDRDKLRSNRSTSPSPPPSMGEPLSVS
mmetsp:Transcript_12917/g.21121  ORF Transcript_12917/g.21121 Transcript_12917/m.21121 type:complete len:1143 (-) Transcript_12917:1034-4462(-)